MGKSLDRILTVGGQYSTAVSGIVRDDSWHGFPFSESGFGFGFCSRIGTTPKSCPAFARLVPRRCPGASQETLGGGGADPDEPAPCQHPSTGGSTHPTDLGTRVRARRALTLEKGQETRAPIRENRGVNIDAVIEKLRDARRALLFGEQEQRVSAYYSVEDAAAELSALLLSTDVRSV